MKRVVVLFLAWCFLVAACKAGNGADSWFWGDDGPQAGTIIIGGIHPLGRGGESRTLTGEQSILPGGTFAGSTYGYLEGVKNVYAALSKCSYSKKECRLPSGWRKLSDREKRQLGIDPELFDSGTGFHAELFRNIDGSYVIGFEGTDSWRDLAADLGQGVLPAVAAQYHQAARLAKRAEKILGKNLLFTGHSLGGGLASLAAVLTGNRAITFNAAGLNPATVSMQVLPLLAEHNHGLKKVVELGLNWQKRNELVTSYRVRGDELTTFQEKMKRTGMPLLMLLDILAPDAVGRKVNLKNPPGLFEHGIDSVLAAPLR